MTSTQTPRKAQPLPRSAIKVAIAQHPVHDWHLEYLASLHVGERVGVDKDALRSRPEADEDIKRRLRHAIREKLYGKVRQDAREAFLAIRESISNGAPAFETWKIMETALAPLLDAGHELTD